MTGALSPVRSFADFEHKFERLAARAEGRTAEYVAEYPFYAVLLYQAIGGLDERLSAFLADKVTWEALDKMTGETWMLAALEQPGVGPAIGAFEPNDVYRIAAAFSVPKDLLPALVVFTDPLERNDLLRQPLLPVLMETPNRDALTRFFQAVTAAMERHAGESAERRLESLENEFEEKWSDKESPGSRLKSAMIVATPAINLFTTFVSLGEQIAHIVARA